MSEVLGRLQWLTAPSLSSRLLPPPHLARAWGWPRLGQPSQVYVSWRKGAGYQPALGLQFAADGSQGEEGWGAVCGDKLLPEELYVEAKVQCSGQAVRICIHLPDDLQMRRWLVRNGLWWVRSQGSGILVYGQEGWVEEGDKNQD